MERDGRISFPQSGFAQGDIFSQKHLQKKSSIGSTLGTDHIWRSNEGCVTLAIYGSTNDLTRYELLRVYALHAIVVSAVCEC